MSPTRTLLSSTPQGTRINAARLECPSPDPRPRRLGAHSPTPTQSATTHWHRASANKRAGHVESAEGRGRVEHGGGVGLVQREGGHVE